ncbi:hypothetical protein NF681_11555 [Comamonadaceae bacterium OTU4NAUVB1]|nr:hypothetical protein NF681_11555 [Comamonadaceae bacterium OTU4NAUVB1]
MSFATFGDFQDLSISSWIKNAFSETQKKSKISSSIKNKSEKKVDKPKSTVNFLRFVAAGAALALAANVQAEVKNDKVEDHAFQFSIETENHQDNNQNFAAEVIRKEASNATTQLSFVANKNLLTPTAFSIGELLLPSTKNALGASGLIRLEQFLALEAGWDSGYGEPLNIRSLEKLSFFLEESRIQPPRLGTFMSQDGNLIINWLDANNKIIELEFSSNQVSIFKEKDSRSYELLLKNSGSVEKILRIINS